MNCDLCLTTAKKTEAHVIMSCNTLSELRNECGITDWCQRNNLIQEYEDKKLRLYLGEDGVVGSVLKERGKVLIRIRDKFLSELEEKYEKEMKSLNEIDLRQRANYDLTEPMPVYGQDHPIWDSWSRITGVSE